MKILTTADGERIVMDDDTADFLLGAEGEALLRRKQLADEVAYELRAREREDDEETMAEIRLHARIEERRERARERE